ncbi:MAG: DNA primase [Candidatus Hatepunaea meridiana]|nr:DNA primase [Candidatus Hatepunaea meridiana]
MPGYYDNSDIEKVRDAIDIAEIVGDYVTLKQKRPGDWWGQCPFHQEKTASFHVMSDRSMFHCFGCGKGGNVFTFLMEMEGVSFIEAARSLAERAGIQLKTTTPSGSGDKTGNIKDQLYQVNKLAESWFHSNLTKKARSKEATLAYQYLIERGITPDIINNYKLGWAETGWDGLLKWIEKSGYKPSLIADAGLVSRRKDGSGYIDRFHGRIMFPIHNLSGKAVAFGGRSLDKVTLGEDPAKYINTSETSIYHKGDTLYGLFNARVSIRKIGFAYLVEGYTDLLALIQAGLTNSTASLGTALTQSQARLLKRFTSKVVIVYDSDGAGIAAAKRAADVLTVAGLEARMAMLPEGEDPDSLLRKGGSDLLVETLQKNISFVQFYVRTSMPAESVNSSGFGAGHSEKLNAVRDLLTTIKAVKDPLQNELLLTELSEVIEIREEAIHKAIGGLRRRTEWEEAVKQEKLQIPKESLAERDLIKALLGHPELISEVVTELSADFFRSPLLKKIYLILERACLRGETVDIISLPDRSKSPVVRSFIAEAVISGMSSSTETSREEIKGCIIALNKRSLQEQKTTLEQKIRHAVKEGNPTHELMRELKNLDKQMFEIR